MRVARPMRMTPAGLALVALAGCGVDAWTPEARQAAANFDIAVESSYADLSRTSGGALRVCLGITGGTTVCSNYAGGATPRWEFAVRMTRRQLNGTVLVWVEDVAHERVCDYDHAAWSDAQISRGYRDFGCEYAGGRFVLE